MAPERPARSPEPPPRGYPRLLSAAGAPPPVRPGKAARSAAGSGPRSAAWRALAREVAACRRCPLGASRTQTVFYRGGAHPRIVFVGEAPGREEDRDGRPFVGRAGRRLDAALRQVGLPPAVVGVLNVVKCHPPENRLGRAPLAACRPYLERQLGLLGARFLVPLGAHALAALDPTAPPISRAAGHPRSAGGFRLFPLLHPAATFHSGWAVQRWEHDVERLRRWVGRTLETL